MSSPATPEVPTDPSQLVKDDTFVLNEVAWHSLQAYVANALRLPTTEAMFRDDLGMRATEDFSKFNNLLSVYISIYNNSAKWRDTTYPSIVELAADIVHYASDVDEYYGGVIDLLDQVRKDPSLRQDCLELLQDRLEEAEKYAGRAAQVYNDVKEFADATASDQGNLKEQDKYLEKELGDLTAKAKDAREKIKTLREELENFNKEYWHAVTVASTTVTYAWVGPIGLIAAATVAGIFGDKAVKLKNKVEATTKAIQEKEGEAGMAERLGVLMQTAEDDVDRILDLMEKALPVIQLIQGRWNAIATDIRKIVDDLTTKLEKPLAGDDPLKIAPMKVALRTSISRWQTVAEKADTFREHAFVTIPAPPQG